MTPPAWLRLGPWLVAAVGGALWALCFGSAPRSVAPWIALVPLFLALGTVVRMPRGRAAVWRVFALGWLHGTVFWLASIPWIAPTLVTFGGLPSWLSWLLLLALALYLGAYTGAFGALALPIWRRATGVGGALAVSAALLGLPGIWVALEWLRGWLFSGFPWNLAGYAWTGVPGALPLGAWIGAWGVGFLAVAVNASIGLALVRRVRRTARPEGEVEGDEPVLRAGGTGDAGPAIGTLLSVLLLLAIAARYAVPAGEAEGRAGAGSAIEARIVQPAIYNQVEYDPETTNRGLRRLFLLSEQACDRPGAVVIWPESATWPYELERDAGLASQVNEFVRRTRCPVVLNSTHRTGRPHPNLAESEIYYNSAYIVRPDGTSVRYDKRHLVPFGEYVPLAGVFSFIDSLARSAGDYTPADEVMLLPFGAGGRDRFGMAICFEVTFPAEVADLSRAGANGLVTITNDAWYGDTWAPWQHFTAARWRAAENRRWLLRAAITGVSGVIAPDGSVRESLGVGTEGTLSARVVGRGDLSPFARWPLAVPIASLVLAIAALASTLGAPARNP